MRNIFTGRSIKKGMRVAAGMVMGSFLLGMSVPFVALAQAQRFCGERELPTGEIVTDCNFPSLAACQGTAGITECIDQNVYKVAAQQAAERAAKGNGAVNMLFDQTLGKLFKLLAWFFFWVSGKFMVAMSLILDYSISKNITSGLLGQLRVVDQGWKLVRDLCNMLFIFVLLYIAIGTILDLGGIQTKRMLANLIIAALLINFSLFFGKVIIDAGNILAQGFWQKMKTTTSIGQVESAGSWFLGGSDIQTLLDPESAANKAAGGGQSLKEYQMGMIYAGGAIVMLVMGYVFLAGAIMMIIRLVALIFLLIVSPFAFLSLALPKFQYFDQWLGEIMKHSFSAPILIILLYLDTLLITGLDIVKLSAAEGTKFGSAFLGNASDYAIILQFGIIVGLFVMSLHIAQKFSGSLGGKSSQFAKVGLGMMGGYFAAGGGAVMRQSAGWASRRIATSDRVQKIAERKGLAGGLARGAIRYSDKAQNSTFDLRGSKIFASTMGNVLGKAGIHLGEAGKGGYKQKGSAYSALGQAVTLGMGTRTGYAGTDKEKKIIADSESLKYGAARRENLRNSLGTEGGQARYDSYDLKDERVKVQRKVATDAAKREMEKSVKSYEENEETLKSANDQVAKLVAQEQQMLKSGAQVNQAALVGVQQQLATQRAEASKVQQKLDAEKAIVAGHLANLTGNEVAELDIDKFLSKNVVQDALSGKDITALNKKLNDGTIDRPQFAEKLTQRVLRNGSDSAQDQMRKLARNAGSAFVMDFKKTLDDRVAEYKQLAQNNQLAAKHASGVTNAEYYRKEVGDTIKMMGSENVPELEHLLGEQIVVTQLSKRDLGKIEKLQNEEGAFTKQQLDGIMGPIIAEYTNQINAGKQPNQIDPRLKSAYDYLNDRTKPGAKPNAWNS